MWYPPVVTVAPVAEVVTIATVRSQTRIDADDAANLTRLASLIGVAGEHLEGYCGTAMTTRTVRVRCDSFADFERLPFGPVQSITSISYVDSAGVDQILDPAAYEVRIDALEASIAQAFAMAWPTTRAGSRITIIAVIGYATVPRVIEQAALLLIASMFETRENEAHPDWTMIDVLLVNSRLGA
jgi:uncharacterized phiE125 gp8 family phage protein